MYGFMLMVTVGDFPRLLERLGRCMASLNAPRQEWARLFCEPTQEKLNHFLAEVVELPIGSLGERATAVVTHRTWVITESSDPSAIGRTGEEWSSLLIETPGGVIITARSWRGNNENGDELYSVAVDFGRDSRVLAEEVLSVAFGVTENGWRLLEQAFAAGEFGEGGISHYLAELLKSALEERGLEVVEDLGSFRVQLFGPFEAEWGTTSCLEEEIFLPTSFFGEVYDLLEGDAIISGKELMAKLQDL